MKTLLKSSMLYLVALFALFFLNNTANAQCGPVNLVPITTGFNGLIGIDHHSPTNQVIVSVNWPSGEPWNLETVSSNGTHTQYSVLIEQTEELKVATAKDDGGGMSMGGFPAGTTVTGTGVPGEIVRISPTGVLFPVPWVTLPDEFGLMRGSFYFDRTGIFNGDLIAVTTEGGVWRIDNNGNPTMLANLLTHLEGVVTLPNNAAKYGPWAGKILIGAEDTASIYTVDVAGNVASYQIGINPEDIDIIPPNENFFGVDFGSQQLKGSGPAQFTCMVGDLLIPQEDSAGILYHVWWDGHNFQKEALAEVVQWEHVTFSTAGIDPIPPTTPCNMIATCSKPTPPSYQHGFDVICGYGGYSSINLSVSVSGGTPRYTYSWTGPGSIVDGNTANPRVTPPCPADPGATSCYTYTVVVTDVNGCTATCTIRVSVINIGCVGHTNNGYNVNDLGQAGNGVIQSVNAQQHIYICHVPPGNNSIGMIKCLPVPAINDHLANHPGDYLGPCGATNTCGQGMMRTIETLANESSQFYAFPNPFTSSTTLRFSLPENTSAKLIVSDALGREVATLFNGDVTAGEMYEVEFNAGKLGKGIYFARLLNAEGEQRLVKLVVE